MVRDGMETEGMVTEGTEIEGIESDGRVTEGTESDGKVTEGIETDGRVTDGIETEGIVGADKVRVGSSTVSPIELTLGTPIVAVRSGIGLTPGNPIVTVGSVTVAAGSVGEPREGTLKVGIGSEPMLGNPVAG